MEGANRSDLIAEYVSIGAMPGAFGNSLADDLRLERALSQSLFLYPKDRPAAPPDHARLVSGLLTKLLQRGRTPLPTLGIEREALRTRGLLDKAEGLGEEGPEMGWELRQFASRATDSKTVLRRLATRKQFKLSPSMSFGAGLDTELMGSTAEALFLEQWVPQTLGPSAGHWFTPQAPLDVLLDASGASEDAARRIDFLFHHPGAAPLAIEVDGPEHEASLEEDEARDASLRAIGIEVLRVANDEMTAGSGAVLDQIREWCERAFQALAPASGDDDMANVIAECALAAKVQFALARAIKLGLLTAGQEWEVRLTGGNSVAVAGVLDVLRLLSAYDCLYGGQSTPTRCTVHTRNKSAVTWTPAADGTWERQRTATQNGDVKGERLRVVIESDAGPFHDLPKGDLPDFIIRPAFLPVNFATEGVQSRERQAIAPTRYEEVQGPLTTFLQNVFRKRAFRPHQGLAVYNILSQNDCIALLPTGAGKSIIYQLAGLLMPGITLVVDPIIALMEDQVEGLRRYGIDRALFISRSLVSPEERRRFLRRMERGEYQFVLLSPERLQSPEFRGALGALAVPSLVNLAVIDEAHCVSEWGHDFRPAYLNLADNLRNFGKDGSGRPPPILALSGTASRAVLRDMLTYFKIDRNRSDALIRPASFDRKELRFEIIRTGPQKDPKAALRGMLNRLPDEFNLPRAQFFRAAGRETASGIVFVRTINGPHGLLETQRVVRSATGADVTIYSGTPPKGVDWKDYEALKRENAAKFKDNKVPLLVATKAFGMGIDKPNIRFTIHHGMPQSLENFYQEAGRAGRDEHPALCAVVFSEYDPDRSDELLDPGLDLETLQHRFEQVNKDRLTSDDVILSLWFHLKGFRDVETELKGIEDALDSIGKISTRRTVPLSFAEGDADHTKQQEKAFYRLLKLGVIADYTIEWGSRKFVLQVNAFDIDHCKRELRNFVEAVQPARVKVLERQLDTIATGVPSEVAKALARVLLKFIYDMIERSRRGMIREAVHLARNARTDAEIRTRLLDYLQEGRLGAEAVEQMLQESDIDLTAWLEAALKMETPVDAGELRGLCIRALESYPDHPGLLLVRGISEAMCSDHDERVSSQGISFALQQADDYDLDPGHIDSIVDPLFNFALTDRASSLRLTLTYAMFLLGGASAALEPVQRRGLARAAEFPPDASVMAVLAAQKIDTIVKQVGTAVERQEARYQRAQRWGGL